MPVLLSLLGSLSSAQGATLEVTPADDLWGTLSAVVAGDEVVIHAGTYTTPGYVGYTFAGTESAPIVIRAAEGEAVHIVGGSDQQNVLNVGGAWYTLAGLEISGGSHGIRVETSAHATFSDLHIHDVGDVGLSMNRTGHTYEALVVRGLHIHDTGGSEGECMYLGCNDDGCQVWDSLIEGNLCHDTTPAGQGDGIELKTGSYRNIIRHNVIYNTHYPGITLYSTRGRGDNLVEGNVVFGTGDNGIQVVGEVTVINNLVFNAGSNGIQSKASQDGIPTGLRILHNTVVGAGAACLKANDWTSGGTDILVANNALLCPDSRAIHLAGGPGPATLLTNATLGDLDPSSLDTLRLSDTSALSSPATLDAWPTDGSPLLNAGTPVEVAADFNCTPRDSRPDIGAYEWLVGGNPGWIVQAGALKPACPEEDPGPGDTGTPAADDTAAADSAADSDSAHHEPSAADGCGGCSAPGRRGGAGLWMLLPGLALLRARRS